jgi:P27 family predicted phage terminase small subunit
MKRGRKPKPTALKLAQGNAGHRPINKLEPVAPEGIPTWPTAHIKNKVAQERFFSLVAELQTMDMLSTIDVDALVNYCIAYSRQVKAEEMLQKEGYLVKVGSQKQPNNWLSVSNKAMEQMRKIGAEFGLSPSSRSSLRIPPKDKPSELEKLLSAEAG